MIKIIDILKAEPFKITCKFNNGEVRQLDFNTTFNEVNKHKYLDNILRNDIFNKVKIGDFGQLYWENSAYMKDFNGDLLACEYDISPEFFYYNSIEA